MATKKAVAKRSMKQIGEARIAFIRSVKLAGLGLDSAQAEVDRIVLAEIGLRKGEMSVDVSIGHAVLEHTDDGFVVSSKFELRQQEEGTEIPVISIAAVFSAKFDLTQKASLEAIEAFAGLEARLVFFPYIRQFVSDLSYRMSIDPIVLPLTSEFQSRK